MRARSNFAGVVRDDLLAVAHDRDAVGEHQRFFERMRNEDDRHAAFLEVAHEVEEIFLLFGGERRSRLVEDDHLGLIKHGAGDFDHLLLGRAERRDGGGRRHVEVQRLQELLGGDIDAAQAVVEMLLPEKEVLRHRHRRHEAVLLEDHGDAEIGALPAANCGDTLTPSTVIVPDGQRHDARHDFGERRFAGAVLADERVDLSSPEFEIDAIDRGHAGIELGRLLSDSTMSSLMRRIPCRAERSGSLSTRPGPFAIMTSSPSRSTADTTP